MEWQLFESLPDPASAKVRVGLLQNGGVPAKVVCKEELPGDRTWYEVFVPSVLFHRAKWLSAESRVTDQELDFAATGELRKSDGSS